VLRHDGGHGRRELSIVGQCTPRPDSDGCLLAVVIVIVLVIHLVLVVHSDHAAFAQTCERLAGQLARGGTAACGAPLI